MRRALVFPLFVRACGARTGLGSGGGGSTDAGADASHDANDGCRDEIIATDTVGATALAIDGDTVFWGTVDGRVFRHDATGNTLLATDTSAIGSVGFDAGRVYYTVTGFLRAVPRLGGATSTIADKMGLPFALVIDRGSAFLLDYGQGIAAGRALRVELDGTVKVLLAGLDVPGGLAVDATNVYVACKLALVDQKAIMGPLLSVPKNGGATVVVTSDLKEPSSVAVDASRVFFIDQVDAQSTLHGGLRAIAKLGGPVTTVTTTPDVLPLDVTVEPSVAYVTTFSNTAADLFVVGLDGSKKTSLAATPSVLYGVVRTNDHAIYWTLNWSGTRPAGTPSVRKLCK